MAVVSHLYRSIMSGSTALYAECGIRETTTTPRVLYSNCWHSVTRFSRLILLGEVATIDDEFSTGHETGLVARNKQHPSGDLFGFSDPSHRRGFEDGFVGFVVLCLDERRIDDPRVERVDANTVLCVRDRSIFDMFCTAPFVGW